MNMRRRQAFFIVLCIVAMSLSTLTSSSIAHGQAHKTSGVPGVGNTITSQIQAKYYSGSGPMCLGIIAESKQQNALAVLWPCNGNPDQNWILNVTSVSPYGSTFQIKNQNSQLCLGLYQGTTQEGSSIQQFACNTNRDQSWEYYTTASDPSQNIYNDSLLNQNSLQCMGLPNGAITKAVPLQWACNGNNDQAWYIVGN